MKEWPGVGIFLHIVRDVNGGQHPFQSGRGAPCEAIFGAIADDDRTCAGQQGFGILGNPSAVVDAGCRELPAGRSEQQGESATHAEADDPDFAGAPFLPGEPCACRRLDILPR